MHSDRLLADEFMATHPIDVARILERLPALDTVACLQDVSPIIAANVLTVMTPLSATPCLERLEVAGAAALVGHLPIDTATVILRRMDTTPRTALLEALPRALAGALRRILQYPEGTAGALMDPRVCTIPEDMTVEQVLTYLRQYARSLSDYVYVVNREHRLVGCVHLAQLLLAQPHDPIPTTMQQVRSGLAPTMSHLAIVTHPQWQQVSALPVLDATGVFLGVIDFRTLRRLERTDAQHPRAERPYAPVATALGELYWIGLSSFIGGTLSAVQRSMDKPPLEPHQGGRSV